MFSNCYLFLVPPLVFHFSFFMVPLYELPMSSAQGKHPNKPSKLKAKHKARFDTSLFNTGDDTRGTKPIFLIDKWFLGEI